MGARPVRLVSEVARRIAEMIEREVQEHAAMRSWWKVNSSKFPAGKLHRWGRTFEPNAVD